MSFITECPFFVANQNNAVSVLNRIAFNSLFTAYVPFYPSRRRQSNSGCTLYRAILAWHTLSRGQHEREWLMDVALIIRETQMAEEESLTASEPLAMEETFTHWSRYVEITFGASSSPRVIAVVQDPDSFVLGTTVWDSSKTLLKFIEQHSDTFRKFTSICELGAGCGGLAGIACAINNNGLSDVVMTDIGPVLPWLRRNVRSNLSVKESERVRIEQHAWCV